MDIFFQRVVAVAMLIISFAFLLRSLGFDRVRWRRRGNRELIDNFEEHYHHFISQADEFERRIERLENLVEEKKI